MKLAEGLWRNSAVKFAEFLWRTRAFRNSGIVKTGHALVIAQFPKTSFHSLHSLEDVLMAHHPDTFLLSLDSGRYDELPIIRRRDKIFYAEGAQARVLEACRRFGIRLELLADHFSISRPALTLILRGCDPIPQFLHPQLNLFVKRAAYLTGKPPSSPPLHVMSRRAVSMRGSHA